MDKKILKKTLLKLSSVNPHALKLFIDSVQNISDTNKLFNKIQDFIKKNSKREDDVKVMYLRFKKEFDNDNLIKMLEEEYPFVLA